MRKEPVRTLFAGRQEFQRKTTHFPDLTQSPRLTQKTWLKNSDRTHKTGINAAAPIVGRLQTWQADSRYGPIPFLLSIAKLEKYTHAGNITNQPSSDAADSDHRPVCGSLVDGQWAQRDAFRAAGFSLSKRGCHLDASNGC